MTVAINAVAATIANEIKLFRQAAVTSENRGTPFARAILASLVAGTQTPALVTSAVLHAFGNPKSPKGKPLDKLSGSGDHVVGFGATRKTVSTAFEIFDNIDADAPRAAIGEVDAIPGAAAIRPLVVSFILNEAGAPKSLAALASAVKTAIAAHTASIMPANDEAKEENEEAAKTDPVTPAAVNLTIAQRIADLIVAIQADPEALAAGSDADNAIGTLYETINATYAFLAEADAEPMAQVG